MNYKVVSHDATINLLPVSLKTKQMNRTTEMINIEMYAREDATTVQCTDQKRRHGT